jgi:hypothetical protein
MMSLRFSMFFLSAATAALAAEPLAKLPFELHRGLIFTDVAVNGKTVRLAIDSAAGRAALDLDTASAIGLKADLQGLSEGPNTTSPQTVRVARDVVFRIGNAEITEPFVVVYSLGFLAQRIEHPVAGIVGGQFFRQFVVELDYPNHELRLHKPEAFTAPAKARVVPMEVTPADFVVAGNLTPAAGKKDVGGSFSLDTGAAGADVVLWKLCTESGQALAAARDVQEVQSTAFGGSRPAKQGRLDRLRVGEVEIVDPEVRFTDVNAAGNAASRLCGNLGSKFFERFNVIFDAPHGKLILQ